MKERKIRLKSVECYELRKVTTECDFGRICTITHNNRQNQFRSAKLRS